MTDSPSQVATKRHYMWDLEPSVQLVTPQRALLVAPLTDLGRSTDGSATLSALATHFDMVGSDPAMVACRPDWTATQDVSMHGAQPLTDGPIVVDSRLVRVGSKVCVVDARVYDAHGRGGADDIAALAARIDAGDGVTLAATGLMTFARLPRAAAPHMDDYNPAAWVGKLRPAPAIHDGGGASLAERMGLRIIDASAGVVELECTPYVVNTIDTIIGGAQMLMVEVAAQCSLPGSIAIDLQMRFLSQLKVGPARTACTLVRECRDHSVVDLRVVDVGYQERLLALATVTLRAPTASGTTRAEGPPRTR